MYGGRIDEMMRAKAPYRKIEYNDENGKPHAPYISFLQLLCLDPLYLSTTTV
jgi:hypothetical protein